MKNKDHRLLGEMYSQVKTPKLFRENVNGDTTFTSKVDKVSVYNVDSDSYSLGIDQNELQLIYAIDIEYRSWGIKDFNIFPKKIMPFSIEIQDDYNELDFAESRKILTFDDGLDATSFKVGDVVLKQGSSLSPTMIDLWIKEVDGQWQIVPEMCEISFI